ncbi:uncharacterized protein LAESUDRAFT_749432 [Laetiporus sulphureus 93-53]|uniref:DUF6534 domain-containing protein n=1 Tax=Laetiporus sulphureus 93-53 TaxID=1314785 RepID=A0A165EP25_9APHY|nr:uncharacterized protein LAESUDRAFT_749432 [Laetiporus sulphureus 93-53]KZT07465.1 hypothetical protein LAESUDRAFT_749432 [Laetiporus sulphureus 93-53]
MHDASTLLHHTHKAMASSDSLSLLAGPQLLAFVFNWGLLGILNTQVYVYYCNFPADRIYLRCLVYGILTFEWVQTGLVTAQMFDVYLYNYAIGPPSSPPNGFAATVQLFFAWRIFALAKPSKLHRAALRKAMYALVLAIVILSVGQAISGVTGGILARVSPSARDMDNAVTPLMLWLALSAVDDVLIATTMCILLLKSRTGFASTDALIHRIMKLTVETNAATGKHSICIDAISRLQITSAAFFAVILAIIAGIPPTDTTLIYQFPSIVLPKVYANSFLANINSRASLRQQNAIGASLQVPHIATSPETTVLDTVADIEASRENSRETAYNKDRDLNETMVELNPVGSSIQQSKVSRNSLD